MAMLETSMNVAKKSSRMGSTDLQITMVRNWVPRSSVMHRMPTK